MNESLKHDSKKRRRVEASERQARYDALTIEQKKERAQNAPGASARELKRLDVAKNRSAK